MNAKNQKRVSILICWLSLLIWIALIASLFTACTLYEQTDIEMIRCPEIRDTLLVPDWGAAQN